MNSKLIELLAELQDISSIFGNKYGEKAYRRAIIALRQLEFQINKQTIDKFTNGRTRYIGKSIMDKIIEYVNTDKIEELEETRASKRLATYRELSKILGVGPATINKWIEKGITSLTTLRKAISAKEVILNNMQKWGLRYYIDLNLRIPRAEVVVLCSYIKERILQLDNTMIFEVAGSFRRGRPDSGDIDIIITNKTKFRAPLLAEFVALLESDINFITTLSVGSERLTYLYKSPISGRVRQIDILNIKYSSFYAALLYFTGDAEFNESMRGYAKARGYKLNQFGLFKIIKGKEKIIRTSDEREIFKILDLPYINPPDRTGSAILFGGEKVVHLD